MTQEGSKMFEAVSKVRLSAPKALQTTGLDLVNFGPFYGLKLSQTPLTNELPSHHLNLYIADDSTTYKPSSEGAAFDFEPGKYPPLKVPDLTVLAGLLTVIGTGGTSCGRHS
jgi:hypothetical protein